MSNNNFNNKITDIKKRENDRRIELGMLGLLIDKYPNETQEKLRKSSVNKRVETSVNLQQFSV